MTKLVLDACEVVGFNGGVVVESGRALPVVRRLADQCYSVLDWVNGSPQTRWMSSAEAELLAQRQHWTRLAQVLSLPVLDQPTVVFVDDIVLDEANIIDRPDSWHNEHLTWVPLQAEPCTVMATICSGAAAEEMLNSWAEALLERYQLLFRHRTIKHLQRLADFALCTAKAPSIRWLAHLRYALTQDAERRRRNFDFLIQREFPHTGWEDFSSAVERQRQQLLHLTTPKPASAFA